MSDSEPRAELERRIELIESAYEFMLAYAAQGRQSEKGAAAGRNVRDHLEGMAGALDGLGAIASECAARIDPEVARGSADFFAAVEADARVARAAVRLVLARADVSSQLVDNLNASIHLRALLTDLFIVDEALKPANPR